MATMLSRFAHALHSPDGMPVPGPKSSSGDTYGSQLESGKETSGVETVVDEYNGNDTRLHIPDNVPRTGVAQEYDEFRVKAESEERRAFYYRLAVAWTLFLVFWTIGSAIFMVTEGWTYGVAMYFCTYLCEFVL